MKTLELGALSDDELRAEIEREERAVAELKARVDLVGSKRAQLL